MLKAMWGSEMVPRPRLSRIPVKPSRRSKACTKNRSIITAIVTSGMMMGRYKRPSIALWPRKRNRSIEIAAAVPSTTDTTVDTAATIRVLRMARMMSSLRNISPYQRDGAHGRHRRHYQGVADGAHAVVVAGHLAVPAQRGPGPHPDAGVVVDRADREHQERGVEEEVHQPAVGGEETVDGRTRRGAL